MGEVKGGRVSILELAKRQHQEYAMTYICVCIYECIYMYVYVWMYMHHIYNVIPRIATKTAIPFKV